VKDPDGPFWEWDGKKRELEAWNKRPDSSVGLCGFLCASLSESRPKHWEESDAGMARKIGYGDRNISSGIDVFWLPNPPDRKTLLVTPMEQAEMIAQLVEEKLPFSARTLAALKSL
jgi:beta-lactamase class D